MTSLNTQASCDRAAVAAAPTLLEDDCGEGPAAAVPRAFETICLDLLNQLGQLLTEAIEYRKLSQHGKAAASGKQMLLTLLDFAEENLAGEALQEVQDRVADAYDKSKVVDRLVATQSWPAVRRMLGKSMAAESDVAEARQGLGGAISVAVIAAVAGGGDRFAAGSKLANQMAHSLKSLIDGLRTEW